MNEFVNIITHLEEDLAGIHIGRATPAMVENIMVEAYNTTSPLQQLAAITAPGAQLLLIQPWDHSIIKEVEKALRTTGRDLNPVVDGTTLRINLPALTQEKRQEFAKQAKALGEQAHVAVKRQREELMQTFKQQKNDKQLSEDAFFSEQKKLQRQVDECNALIEKKVTAKEQSLLQL